MALILLILSIAPVVFFGYMIYKRDFDKEPTETLVKLFLCGIGSTFLTLLITKVLTMVIPFFGAETSELNVITLIPYVFIGVALIEEFSKWIFVYKLEYNDQEFNHLYDGIVYAAFVALGFACFENILYVFTYGVQTAIVRAVLAIPGHLCDGIMMGYYLSMAKLSLYNNNKELSKKNILLSLAVPTIAHGLYDYLLFASELTNNSIFILVFLAFVIFFFILASKKVKQLEKNTLNLNPNYITKRARAEMQKQMYTQGYGMYNQGYQQSTYNNQPQQSSYPQQTNVNVGYGVGYQQPTYNNQVQTMSYAQSTQATNGYTPDSYNPYNNQPTNKFCSNCGTPIVGKFCSKCGKEV